RQIERDSGGALRLEGRGQRVGVREQRVQRIGDILVGGYDRGLVLRRSLQQSLIGGALGVQQGAAGKHRLRDVANQGPKWSTRAEQLAEFGCRPTVGAGDR